jgi:hypothetical protein
MHDAMPDDAERPSMVAPPPTPEVACLLRALLPPVPPPTEAPWPHSVEGFDSLPEHLRQAVIDAPRPSAELADQLRAIIPITPPAQ